MQAATATTMAASNRLPVPGIEIAGSDAAPCINELSPSHSPSLTKTATGRSAGIIPAITAPAMPAYIKAATSGPASALVNGATGLSVPKTTKVNGAVVAIAPKPVASAPARTGGSQRLSRNAYTGTNTARPAIAR